jgi:fumarate reductase flavoprotein subunit
MGAMWMAAIDSKLQKSLGVKIDKHEAVAEICRYGGHLADQKLVKLWADKSGEVMDWLIDVVESAGLKMMVETDLKVGYYKSYPVGHVVVPDPTPEIAHLGEYGSALYMPVLTEKAKELGVDIRYEMPAVQLIKQDGKITGVIAGSEDNYTQFNVSKGVILATGGYGRNAEMLEDLCPTAKYCASSIVPAVASGDGVKMGVWAGGALDPLHAVMVFDRGVMKKDTPMGPPWSGGYLRTGSQPFLRVNIRGERFVNEDLPYDYVWDAGIMQPEGVSWQIWDANWKEDITRFHTTICSRVVPHPEAPPRDGLDFVEQEHANFVKNGFIIAADTIEELAQKMEVPVETFKATINRYNELAKQGRDDDFGKVDFRLSTIDNPPFYAAKLSGTLLCNINGLRINTDMQVLDENLDPIPGLYAVGNDSGSFFSYNYPQMFGGLALGRTITFGRLAGIAAAKV